MDQSPPPDTQLAGLTLILTGSFDPHVFLEHLPLRAIRYEEAASNTVTVLHSTKPPTRVTSTRKIEADTIKFSVKAPHSIPQLFYALLAALPSEARSAWNHLAERTADLGVYWTNARNTGTEYDIPNHIIKSLGEHGITLRISVYATGDAMDALVARRS
jgi:hypothetical protein